MSSISTNSPKYIVEFCYSISYLGMGKLQRVIAFVNIFLQGEIDKKITKGWPLL